MADPFTVTDEQRALRSAVRRFCADHHDEAAVRRWSETGAGFDPAVWRRLGGDLGIPGLAVGVDDGGAGGTLADQAVAVEELGAALGCGPLFGTVYLAVPALAVAPAGPARDALLADLAEGTATAAVTLGARWGATGTGGGTVSAAPDGGSGRVRLSGTAGAVLDAGAADHLLVEAAGADGPSLFAVAGDAPGLRRSPLVTLDLTRPQADVELDGVYATPIAGPADVGRVVGHALRTGRVLLAAEQVGAAAHLLELTVGYARDRRQFGRPIGSFQAVAHRLADMLVAVEHARSTMLNAAASPGDDLDVMIAQATCSEAFGRVAADTVQLHGGIGYTWEHRAHLYLKRAVTDAALLGSPEHHREQVAALVLDTADHVGMPPVAAGTPIGTSSV